MPDINSFSDKLRGVKSVSSILKAGLYAKKHLPSKSLLKPNDSPNQTLPK